jgi:hypothetical protein
LSDIITLKEFIEKTKPDVIFSFATTLAHFAFAAKILTPQKFVIVNGSIRGAPEKLTFKEKIESVLYNIYPYIVANSEAGLKSFGQFNKKGRYVLYNGFNDSRILF